MCFLCYCYNVDGVIVMERDVAGELPSVSIARKRTTVNGVDEVMLHASGGTVVESLEALRELVKINQKLEGGK